MALAQMAGKIGKLSTIYLIGSLVPPVLSLVLLPVFTRELSREQYGLLALSAQVFAPVAVIVQFGLVTGMRSMFFRLDPEVRPAAVRTLFIGQVVQGVLICIVLSILGFWLADRLLPKLPLTLGHKRALWAMLVWAGLLSAIIDLANSLLQLRERARSVVAINLLLVFTQSILGVIAVVAWHWQGFGRQSTIFIAMVLPATIGAVVVWRYGYGQFDFQLFRRIFRTGSTFVASNMTCVLGPAINVWALTRWTSSERTGVYGIALMFGMMVQMPVIAFTNAAYPTFAGLMRDGGPEARRQQSRLYALLTMLIVTLVLGISLFAPVAIRILTAPAYHEAVRLVPILLVGWLFLGLYQMISQTVFFIGGGLYMTAATLAATASNLVLSVVLIPRHGDYGAACAAAGSFFVQFLVMAYYSNRLYPLPWQFGPLLRMLVGAVLLAWLDMVVTAHLAIPLAVLVKVGLLAAVVPIFLLAGVMKTGELAWAIRLVRGKLGLGRGTT